MRVQSDVAELTKYLSKLQAEEDDEQSKLSSMISVRAELARGDLRALYLGWLACGQGGELDDEDREPPVPPGLGQLSASLEANFKRADSDSDCRKTGKI